MPVTRQWLPVDDGFGKQLVDKLVAEGRTFTRSLPYELPAKVALTFAVLSDCGDLPTTLSILRADQALPDEGAPEGDTVAAGWLWHAHMEPLPALPVRSPCGAKGAGPGHAMADGTAPRDRLGAFASVEDGSAASPADRSDEGIVP